MRSTCHHSFRRSLLVFRTILRRARRASARLALLLTGALSAAACADKADTAASSKQTAALVIATAVDPDALLPPLVTSTAGKQVVDLLFDHLADPRDAVVRTDGDGGFTPRLASRWAWAPDSLSIAFTVDSLAHWHDGKPVTAADVAFSFGLYTNPRVGSIHASAFAGIDSVTARDARTAVVWWHARQPEQFFQVAYNLAVLPSHLLSTVAPESLATAPVATAPVGSGRYRFEKWDRKQQLVLRADSTNYRGTPRFARVIWSVFPDANAAATAVLQGQADVIEVLRGDAVAKAAASPVVHTVEYGSYDYGYLIFNLAPAKGASRFREPALRVALSQQIDRVAIVANALDSLGAPALGPFTRALPTVDTTLAPPSFDSTRAAVLLDSLGWRWNSAHTARERAGKPLVFSILIPATSGTRRRLAVLLQEQFARQGVVVEVDAADPALFAKRLRTGDFDAAINVWRDDPSPTGIRQAWGSPRGDDVGANFGRYANARFDATVDSAARSMVPAERLALFRRAYRLILDDAPAIWLYEPRNLAAVRRDVQPVRVRPDGWLASIGDWTVTR
jgi:peptide/nickel transport system substrate-binding protein